MQGTFETSTSFGKVARLVGAADFPLHSGRAPLSQMTGLLAGSAGSLCSRTDSGPTVPSRVSAAAPPVIAAVTLGSLLVSVSVSIPLMRVGLDVL